MIQKIKNSLLVLAASLALLAPAIVPTTVGYAATSCSGVPDQVAKGATNSSGGAVSCDTSQNLNGSTGGKVEEIAKVVINVFSVIVGAASVIMIIYAGFRYITSGGSSERIGNAKTTLIYAIIGLVVVALAQVLVTFVLSTSVGAGNTLS